jgi:hypothetical protein
MPDLLGDAMHVDGKTDASVTDQRNAKFFLPHQAIVRRMRIEGNCVLQMFCL